MCYWFELVVKLVYLIRVVGHGTITKMLDKSSWRYQTDSYSMLIKDVKMDRNFNSILMLENASMIIRELQSVTQLNIPKIIVTQAEERQMQYKEIFNSDIFLVITMKDIFDGNLFDSMAEILNDMRQTRILMIAVSIKNIEHFHKELLDFCKKHKITNVLIHFIDFGGPFNKWMYRIKPYPHYYLENITLSCGSRPYYIVHWRNMLNATLLTLPDQYMENSVVFKDSNGQMQYNGVAAKLVLLFGEKYNASVQLAYDVRPGEAIHLIKMYNMTKDEQVDIAMHFNPITTVDKLIYMGHPTVFGSFTIIFPLPERMPLKDAYSLLIPKDILACIVITSALCSIVLTFIDYVFCEQVILRNLIMSDKVLPGILGQSFALGNCPLLALKLICILVFLLGLNITTMFGANFSTFITSPPYPYKIKTFADLSKSNLKILCNPLNMSASFRQYVMHFEKSILYAPNSSYYQSTRTSLNTSLGYSVSAAAWQMIIKQQEFYGAKLFYTTPNTNIVDFMVYAPLVAANSLFKEPLNRLIGIVQERGLDNAWRSSSILDMIKYKNITAPPIGRSLGHHVLNEDDLWCAWIILIAGLMSAFVIILMESIFYKCMRKTRDQLF